MESITDGVRYIIKFHLESPKLSNYFVASYLMSVREIYPMTELYAKGSILYLDSPNEEATKQIGRQLKDAIEATPVY